MSLLVYLLLSPLVLATLVPSKLRVSGRGAGKPVSSGRGGAKTDSSEAGGGQVLERSVAEASTQPVTSSVLVATEETKSGKAIWITDDIPN